MSSDRQREADERIAVLEHRLDIMVAASVEAWQALGYGGKDAPGFSLAEAIRRRLYPGGVVMGGRDA